MGSSTPSPGNRLHSAGGDLEPKRSSVGTGLGKNSLGGHISASLEKPGTRGYMWIPRCREEVVGRHRPSLTLVRSAMAVGPGQ